MDYITCGTGSYFNFGILMPTFQFADKLGAPMRRGAEAARSRMPRCRPRATSAPPRTPSTVLAVGPGRHGEHRARPDRRPPPRSTRPSRGGPRTCAAASRATRCAGVGARATTGSRASSTRRRAASSSGAATRFAARAPSPKSVLVVGGGPAGLEAARVAAERGHRVTLVEAGPQLGGAFRLAGLQPRRGADHRADRVVRAPARRARRDRARQHARSTVTRRPRSAPTRSSSRPARSPTGTGFQRFHAGAGRDARRRPCRRRARSRTCCRTTRGPGHRVVIVDDVGDWRGTGTAWHLAERGHAGHRSCRAGR